MADRSVLSLVAGEKKVIKFSVVDGNSQEVDLDGCTYALRVVSAPGGVELFTKETADFDVTLKARGIITCVFTDSDLATSGNYEGQLKIVFISEIDKSLRFDLNIVSAIVS